MPRSDAVWGIDIGQCALKALRCRPHIEPNRITADAFDYIEYPKILSQPEADPAELVQEALKEFLSRNTVRGDRVAISVPGQMGLARFVKLPPVESKKIPDMVKFEAKQQIPFALEDVIWDFQQMAGGSEEDGFALETEVGLFAMKREQVYRALAPFEQAGIEVDILQLTPLALYNFSVFDQLYELPPPDQIDPDEPLEWLIVLAIGTDTTDLVVTSGYRVWNRSIPIGGNHFTKALTKELKLTFAKAEHVKRNVATAEDQKAVFQAMRPVFNDLQTEVQRSLNHFKHIHRNARFSRILALGNTVKLPGLVRYLNQQLGMEVERLETYRGLDGATVLSAPVFKDNLLSFAPCYGLALQGLRNSQIHTNLIPRELVRERLIRDKKPWAVGVAAALLLGMSIAWLGDWRAWSKVHQERFDQAMTQANGVTQRASSAIASFESAKTSLNNDKKSGENLIKASPNRERWLDLFKAINICLPTDPPSREEPKDFPERITTRNRVYITRLETQRFDNLATWFNGLPKEPAKPPVPGATPPPAAAPPGATPPGSAGARPTPPPQGPGWVVELSGYHYHNGDPNNERAQYVRESLLANLKREQVTLEDGTIVPIADLGISHPVLLPNFSEAEQEIEDPEAAVAADHAQRPASAKVLRFEFTVQFAWPDKPPAKPGAPSSPPGAVAQQEGS